jgi:ferredoxin
MALSVKRILRQLDVAPSQVAIESFGGRSNTAKDEGSDHPIRFARSDCTSAVKDGTSLLDAAIAARVQIDYGRRAGVCGRCKAVLIEGEVESENDFALSAKEKAAGMILTCQTRALGPSQSTARLGQVGASYRILAWPEPRARAGEGLQRRGIAARRSKHREALVTGRARVTRPMVRDQAPCVITACSPRCITDVAHLPASPDFDRMYPLEGGPPSERFRGSCNQRTLWPADPGNAPTQQILLRSPAGSALCD